MTHNYEGRFAANMDYKAAFIAAVNELYEDARSRFISVEERKAAVATLVDAYISGTGERPNHAQLDRLATFILMGDELERKMAKEAAKAEGKKRKEAA